MNEKNFQIRNEEIEKIMLDIGRSIKSKMPLGWGFALLIFDYIDKGSMFYLSSATRESMLEAMKEFISKNSTK